LVVLVHLTNKPGPILLHFFDHLKDTSVSLRTNFTTLDDSPAKV
jgi:hypothetical protein